MNPTRRFMILAALALIVLTNAVALGGVATNRMGEPQGMLRLTERELATPYVWRDKTENSGLSLQLRWRVLPAQTPHGRRYNLYYEEGGRPEWLDTRKMVALGFAPPSPSEVQPDGRTSRYQRQLPRDAFVVLELDGPAVQESLRRAAEVVASAASGSESANAQAELDRMQRFGSRLFIVDAGLDRDALRARYPDRAKVAIVRGRIRPIAGQADADPGGIIDALSVDAINVPLQLRPVFDGLPARRYGALREPGENFDATVVFGQRSEPWLAAAARR
jgi:Domain of unknown function (DUF4824)